MAEKAYYTYDAITTLPATAVVPVAINPSTVPVSKTITGANLSTSVIATKLPQMVFPSGDETGATDSNAIAAAIASSAHVLLAPGQFYVDEPIALATSGRSVRGHGRNTRVSAVTDLFPCVKISGNAQNCLVQDLWLLDGLYSIEIDNASRLAISGCYCGAADSHGIYIHGGSIILSISNCGIDAAGGTGIHALSVTGGTVANGNGLCVKGSYIEGCGANGVMFQASSGTFVGNVIESNTGSGILLQCEDASCVGVSILGNYFEANTVSCIETCGYNTYAIEGVLIDGNYLNTGNALPAIYCHGVGLRTRRVTVGQANSYTGSTTAKAIQVGATLNTSKMYVSRSAHDMNVSVASRNTVENQETRTTITESFAVACNADKTGAAPSIITLPAGTVLHDVIAITATAMNGSGTKTFEVGVSGNADKYIDSAEFNPASLNDWQSMLGGGSNDQKTPEYLTSDTTIIATWTNTGGTPSAGSVTVKVTYSTESYYKNAVAVPA